MASTAPTHRDVPRAKRAPRTILRDIGLAVAIMVVAYLGFALYLGTRSVVVSVDYVQKLVDSLPKPERETDAAWPAYRDALVRMGFGNKQPRNTDAQSMLGERAGQEGWPTVSGWIDASQDQIGAIREAARRPILGFPIGRPHAGADADFFTGGPAAPAMAPSPQDREHFQFQHLAAPHYAPLRQVARVLASDLERAVEQGDGERATQDAEALMSLAVHVAEGRLLIGDLVSIAIRQMCVAYIVSVMEWRPEVFSDGQLKRMQAALLAVPARLEWFDFTVERMLFEDMVQRTYSDDGNGDGWFVPTVRQLSALEALVGMSAGGTSRPSPLVFGAFVWPLRPIGTPLVASRKDARAHFHASADRVEQVPPGALRDRIAASEALAAERERMRKDPDQVAAYLLESLVLTATPRVMQSYSMDRASREAACAAIAAELCRRATGAWPTSAAELTPFNRGVAPTDPWIDAPIRMSRDGDGFRMWSVGRNGLDDGGNPFLAGSPELSTHPMPDSDEREIDWVWYAPRGDTKRWRGR